MNTIVLSKVLGKMMIIIDFYETNYKHFHY
jgi:hypothetical protein